MPTPYPNPSTSARNNLSRRVERFLKAIDANPRDLTQNELDNLFDALTHLREGWHDEGERSMMLAEKDWPPQNETDEVAPQQTVKELLDELARVVAG